MIRIRRSEERGHAEHGWLDSHHTFSFADYHDPAHMGFGALRVINEDRITPGAGFPTHPHRDMEIISYVLEGALEHEDSMGNGSVIRPGEVQRMSAGTGVTHSEYNQSKALPAHFLQIWIVPERRGIAPGYEQKSFAEAARGALTLVASRDGRDGSVTVHQDVSLYLARLDAGERAEHAFAPSRRGWVQVARGRLRLDGEELCAGDGAALEGVDVARLEALEPSEFLLFDLA